MLRSLLLLLLVSLVLPTVAAADDSLVRGAFGSGTLLASSTRAPAPPCATPPATPESVARAVRADRSGRVRDLHQRRPRPALRHRRDRAAAGRLGVPALGAAEQPLRGGDEPGVHVPDPRDRLRRHRRALHGQRAGAVPADRGVRGPARADGRAHRRPARRRDRVRRRPAGGVRVHDRRERGGADLPLPARRRAARRPARARTRSRGVPDGLHRFCVTATDASGRPSEVPACRAWRQETTPAVELLARPPVATAATAAAFTYTLQQGRTSGRRRDVELRVPARRRRRSRRARTRGSASKGSVTDGTQFAVRTPLPRRRRRACSAPPRRTSGASTRPPRRRRSPPARPTARRSWTSPRPSPSSADEPAAFACAVDGGAPLPCASPFTTPPLSAGAHTVAIAATDAVGNVDPTPATRHVHARHGPRDAARRRSRRGPEALDCDDRDAGVRPGALEVPGNGSTRTATACSRRSRASPSIISASGTRDGQGHPLHAAAGHGRARRRQGGVALLGPQRACPFERRSLRVSEGRGPTARGAAVSFGVGATVEVRVTAPDMIGKVRRMRIVARQVPARPGPLLEPTSTRSAALQRPSDETPVCAVFEVAIILFMVVFAGRSCCAR